MDAELVSVGSDILIALSAVAVAIVAFKGLATWRKELTGKAKFDIARNMMTLGYRLKADFERARFPVSSAEEYADRPRQENESPEASREWDAWYARNKRLQPLIEDLAKLQEAGWEAQVVLSEDASKQVSEAIAVFRSSYGELGSAIDEYFLERIERISKGHAVWDDAWLKELRKDISSRPGDSLSQNIDEAIEKLASALKVYVK